MFIVINNVFTFKWLINISMKLVISKSSDCSESLNVHNVDDKTDVDINLRRNSLCRNEVNIDNFYNGD